MTFDTQRHVRKYRLQSNLLLVTVLATILCAFGLLAYWHSTVYTGTSTSFIGVLTSPKVMFSSVTLFTVVYAILRWSAERAGGWGRSVYPNLIPVVEDVLAPLVSQAKLPRMPRVVIDHSLEVNALMSGFFAKRPSLILTTGLVHEINTYELRGIVAHEVAHLVNKDGWRVLALTCASKPLAMLDALMWWSLCLLFVFALLGQAALLHDGLFLGGAIVVVSVTRLAVELQVRAHSRAREYLADQTARSLLGGSGEPLASGLVVLPLKADATGLRRLLSTHPSTPERIYALMHGEPLPL